MNLILIIEISVSTCKWLGECFVFITSSNRLSYVLGDQAHVLNHFDGPQYLLGYVSSQNRIYVIDKDLEIRSYALAKSLIDYQSAILSNDYELAESILPTIPIDQKNKVARFLESQNLKDLAMNVATDNDQKFELAVELGKLDEANQLAKETPKVDSQNKWRLLGDKALENWDIKLASECFKKAQDLPALLLIYTSSNDREGLIELSKSATEKGEHNVAFAALLQLGNPEECIDCLMRTERFSEAALFASTYSKSRLQECTMAWKNSLFSEKKDKIAKSIAEPKDNPELFNIQNELIDMNGNV